MITPLFRSTVGYVYAGQKRFRIIHHTRRKVVIDTDAGPVELRRSRLERSGEDIVAGIQYRATRYSLPCHSSGGDP